MATRQLDSCSVVILAICGSSTYESGFRCLTVSPCRFTLTFMHLPAWGVKIYISELWDGSPLHSCWLRFYLSARRAFYGICYHSTVDDMVCHLNGEFQYNSRCNLREMLLFGMTKRGNRQFLVDNGGVLLTFDEIKCGKRHF